MITKRQDSRKPLDNDLCELTIVGEPASKANSRRLVKIKKRYAFIKSKKAINYSKDFTLQCPVYDTLYEEDLAIALKIYYKSKKDIDKMLNVAYTKNQSMREALAKVWGLDEGKSPFQKKEEKIKEKTLTGKKPTEVKVDPEIEVK